ncbi:hypothetical protein [Chroococcidiopsis sp. CCNUC1]|uniref:hypothetical protein n=1 Tax=Chroococcidiopsis sp. CCNUC1 TaxID=2653189 RepID=UPI00202290A1|nr:hypothetical protein [Chroococcidiopsis sp. CCNUC1]URD49628.1 hypothetical protein M5J74_25310 [Chroococcidiopsis sp. CCNUC1]
MNCVDCSHDRGVGSREQGVGEQTREKRKTRGRSQNSKFVSRHLPRTTCHFFSRTTHHSLRTTNL